MDDEPEEHDETRGDDDASGTDDQRLLPIANISRIMKRALPPSAKMSKEAKACVQECVSEFIGFITNEASERLVEDKRKTITGDDVIDSMRALGFDAYMAFLPQFLSYYRRNKGKGGPLKKQKPSPPPSLFDMVQNHSQAL